ncbi:MAG: hypothetical protein HRU38_25110 [Saccharospirillaceae bacterium]|nr:hypothetical protein [Saccharospirillaceae bacterium]
MKNRNRWGFQLLPVKPGVLAIGYRVDPLTQSIEDEVDNALPYHFRFHKISKLVILLGPNKENPQYIESNGIAKYGYQGFDVDYYLKLNESEKAKHIQGIILEVFKWLIENYDDSNCFEEALTKLNWS